MATAITVVPSGGLPVTPTNVPGGVPMTIVGAGGQAVTFADNALPITLVDEIGNPMSVFVIPAGGRSAVAAPVTNTLTETALATITIPAGAMGPNGIIRVTGLFNYTNSANAKTMRIRLGGLAGTIFVEIANTTTATQPFQRIIQNRNSQASQGAFPSTIGNSFASSTTSPATGTINTAVAQDLVITGQMAALAETMTLEQFFVEICYGA